MFLVMQINMRWENKNINTFILFYNKVIHYVGVGRCVVSP